MVSVGEAYLAAKKKLDGRYCALTFDDGLKEHYNFVFPILRKYEIQGAFFLIGQTLKEDRISLTHKLHVLLSHLSSKSIRDAFHQFFGGKYHIDNKTRINPRRRFDDVLTSNLKESLIALPLEERSKFIDHLFNIYHDEKDLLFSIFMNPEEAKIMSQAGMSINPHGYSHLSLETLDLSSQKKEIEESIKVIEDITGQPSHMFSPPHGRSTPDTLNILRENEIQYATTIRAGDLTTAEDPLLLPQFDTNHIAL